MADEAKLLDYLKRATADLYQTRARLREVQDAAREPIAIVAMSCRFPGRVAGPEDLWRLVEAGEDAIGPFPEDRGWDTAALYDADPDRPGTSYVREGGFLADPGGFDPAVFGISPREALAMDPQQRIMLELAWEAFERAGIPPLSRREEQIGVFVGSGNRDYYEDVAPAAVEGVIEDYLSTGNAASVLSGRIAYAFGLEGPALTVDTACSSSLVALHLACQALRRRECTMALAGGVMVMSIPGPFVAFSRQRGLAPDGRCKAFSDGADGTGWAEGAGTLLLERLSDARRHGHPVLAVIRGSAVNSDGASNGLTAPNGPSQQRVIRRALAEAGLSAAEVDAVEGHGTGTTLGDPIEAQALLAVYGPGRPAGRPLWLGSVKSNIGHAQAAAGVSGVIKMVMAMRAGVLPRTLHVTRPSTEVDWSAGAVELLTEARPWPRDGRPRRAGVSSFGVSGTNAHLILEEYEPEDATAAAEAAGGPGDVAGEQNGGRSGDQSTDQVGVEAAAPWPVGVPVPWPVSAQTEEALREQARRLLPMAVAEPGPEPAAEPESQPESEREPESGPTGVIDLGYSLATGRSPLGRRAVVLADDLSAGRAALAALAAGEEHTDLVSGVADDGLTAFLFTGQGAQRTGMGKELHRTFPVFAQAFDAVCAEFDLERPVADVVFAKSRARLLKQTLYTQPALFAVEVATARLLESWGVVPDLVLGHSIGGIAAAHVAGALPLADACRLVQARATLMQALPAGGAMVAVQATEDEAAPLLTAGVGIAAVNGPDSVVLSGDEEPVLALAAHFASLGRRTGRLEVSHAFHSPRMEPVLDGLAAVTASLEHRTPAISLVSDLTGGLADSATLAASDYWVRHAREAVRFHQGVRTLEENGVTRFVEVGPGGVLTALVRQCLDKPDAARLIPMLRKARPEARTVLSGLAQLHVAGAEPDWDAVFADRGARRVGLPTYPFEHRRYWIEDRVRAGAGGGLSANGLDVTDHPVLGAAITLADTDGVVLAGRLAADRQPWLADHRLGAAVTVPGTALLELALRAGVQVGARRVDELVLGAPLTLPERGGVRAQITVGAPDERGRRTLAIHARAEDADPQEPWTAHATGVLAPAQRPAETPWTQWPPAGAEPIETDGLYAHFAETGLDYGPAFRGLRAAWRLGADVYAEVDVPEDATYPGERFALSPAGFDAATHALRAADGGESAGRVPFSWSDVELHRTGVTALRVRFSPVGDDGYRVAVADEHDAPVASIGASVFRPLQLPRAAEPLYRLAWAPIAAAGPAAAEKAQALPYEVLRCARGGDAAGVHALVREALFCAQAHAEGEGTGGSAPVLVVVTRGAVAVSAEEDNVDLGGAAVWGLIRSAQLEHPGRFVLVDADPQAEPESLDALLPAVLAGGEPQIAVRGGTLYAARLRRIADATAEREPDAARERAGTPWNPEGTVLITGAAGALGAILARHLVERHGVRNLLLLGRRAGEAVGPLITRLAERGASAHFEPCDVADRAALARVLAGIPAAHPLTAVVHAAGVLDDGVLGTMTGERVDRVLRPKVDGALHLDELTADLELADFILYSSVSGVLGAPGQSAYSAANALLDALARNRRAQGLPARSLAWGLWAEPGGMAGDTERAARRADRTGLVPLTTAEALACFDAALRRSEPDLVPVRFDSSVLRARREELPPALRELAGTVRGAAHSATRAAARGADLARNLRSLTPEERHAAVLDLVRARAAAVLGHGSARDVEPTAPFSRLGFDSLTAIELRNELNTATGLRLPATAVFDYPNCTILAEHILSELADAQPGTRGADRSAVVATGSDGGSGHDGDRDRDDPIAIVGMACRLPGGVTTPDQLWQLLAEGRDGIGEFPDDRGWDVAALYDPTGERPGSSYVRRGGFVDGAGDFDPGFFGVPPREAAVLDPQQRLLLETCWEALERAGIDPATLKGSPTGVYAGVQYHDYVGSNSTGSIVTGRVAYSLGLEGPAISVDTACSSSLVAAHWAAQALRRGECTLALAGGVTVMATPETFVEFSRQRGLAADGRVKAFSADADGTVWSEGAGVLVLERLGDARRHGHPVLAVLRGSAVNQDGVSNGLTAPNGPAQQRVIRAALADAGLAASEVDAVEAHGTGTRLGDPIEAQALLATYGRELPADRPLWVGSIKSNLGHTQAAAGVAGMIKMVLALRHGVLPRTVHLTEPSHEVDWSAGNVSLLTQEVAWPETGRPRRAGVSSFGVSGTNAHLILEQAPAQPAAPEPDPAAAPPTAAAGEPPVLAWPVSGRTRAGLRAQAERLMAFLDEDESGASLVEIGHALAATRTAFEHRAVLIGRRRPEFLRGLMALSDDEEAPGLVEGVAQGAGAGRTAFLFAGQGSQRAGAGAGLYAAYPAFAAAFDEACAVLDAHVGRSVRALAFEEGEELHQTAYTQPVLFALEVAQYRLLESWGVRPDVVAGHSIGELAAAHVAGVLSLADAAELVAARGRLMQALPAGGAMAALAGTPEEVAEALADRPGAEIAAVNGPRSVVVSGDEDAVQAVIEAFVAHGRKATRLKVSHAFHSRHMEPMLAEYRALAQRLRYAPPRIRIVSTVTGAAIEPERFASADYWVQQVRDAVRFRDAVFALDDEGVTRLVELGPDTTLTAMAADCLAERESTAVLTPLLRRERPEPITALTAVARLHTAGHSPDWTALHGVTPERRPRHVDLPTYAFQRRRYWIESPGQGALGVEEHPLLGAGTDLAESGGRVYAARVSAGTHPWLADHAVDGNVLVPGAAFVELALRLGAETGCERIRELTIEAPLVLPRRGGVRLQTTVGALEEDGSRNLTVYARVEGDEPNRPWLRHVSAVLAPGARDGSPDSSRDGSRDASQDAAAGAGRAEWPPVDAEPITLDGLYDELATAGLVYGPAFRGLEAAWRRGDEVFAEVELPRTEHATAERFGLHPALLDAALHAIPLSGANDGRPALPFAWENVDLHAEGVTALRVHVRPAGSSAVTLDLADPTGLPVARVGALVIRAAGAAGQAGPTGLAEPGRDGFGAPEGALYRVDWREASATSAVSQEPDSAPAWTVLGPDRFGLAAALGAPVEDIERTTIDGTTGTTVLAGFGAHSADPAGDVRAELHRALDLLRRWTAGTAPSQGSKLVVVTRHAAACADGEPVDVAGAAVAGLVRSAQAENPDRVLLVDLDADEPTAERLTAALGRGEPHTAIRAGRVLVPRLVLDDAQTETAPAWDPEGTVLITGATGALGGAVAQHLVARHGVRHLLLASRRGQAAEGAAALRERLTEAGAATVTFEACDVADRAALAALLAAIPADRPLRGVVHAAGVLDDATIGSLTPERIDAVLGPKADAALLLSELTEHLDLPVFALFSSAAGVLGAPGQGNYAAANSVLDAVAARRRRAGRAATSLAWGLWDAGMAAGLDAADTRRVDETGIRALSTARGLGLLDAALGTGRAVTVPIALDRTAFAGADPADLPALLRALIPATPAGAGAPLPSTMPKRPARPAASASAAATTTAKAGGRAGAQGPAAGAAGGRSAALAKRLRSLPPRKRVDSVLDLVRAQAAAVLGFGEPDDIAADRAFGELGFDSLSAIGMRNKLILATGLQLPTSLIFDYPSPRSLAEHLVEQLLPDTGDVASAEAPPTDETATAPAAAPSHDAGADREIRGLISAIPVSRLREAGLLEQLVRLAEAEAEAEASTRDGAGTEAGIGRPRVPAQRDNGVPSAPGSAHGPVAADEPGATPAASGGSVIDELDSDALIRLALAGAVGAEN